jgi:hypothetical protein
MAFAGSKIYDPPLCKSSLSQWLLKWTSTRRVRGRWAVSGTLNNVFIDGMTSHGIEAVNNIALVMRNVEASRCGGSGFRSAAASVNMAVENSVSSGQ